MTKKKTKVQNRLRERLSEVDEGILCADGFDDAIIGVAYPWPHREAVAVYSWEKMVKILCKDGCDESEAEEFLSYNTEGAYVGERTPIIVHELGGE